MIIKLSLPNNIFFEIEKGDEINFGDLLYKKNFSQDVIINVADKLSIPPDKIFQYLTKIIGQPIKRGDLLAMKKGLFSVKKIYSDYEGLIKEINHQTGEVVIATDQSKKQNVYSKFRGTLVNIEKTYFELEIKNGKSFSLKEINKDGAGEVFYFENENLFFKTTEEEIKGKIIILKNLKPHLEAKCEALGAEGFIFLEGEPLTDLPFGKINNIDDYLQIYQLKKRYIIFSKEQKIVIVYN